LSGATDEGEALFIFVSPGGFADEAEGGLRVAAGEDGLFAGRVERAAGAGGDDLGELDETPAARIRG
jgi:hypothetical protein